mgnify:CR=1 FL=1
MAGKIKRSKVLTAIYLVALVLVVIAVAGLVAYYLKGATTAAFSVSIDGKTIESGSSVGVLASKSKINIDGAEEYGVAVYACSAENDFAFTVDGEELSWSDIDGRNLTAGFEIERAEDGFTLSYGGIEDIISAAQGGADVGAEKLPNGDIFRLSISAGEGQTDIYFTILSGIFLDRTEIIF